MSSDQDHISELREGPLKKRQCTDICFAFLFVLFIFAMILVGSVGYYNGDPNLILHPFDSSGNQCGNSDYGTQNYSFVYFSNPTDEDRFNVCVESCPTSNWQNISCFTNTWVVNCDNGEVTYKDLSNITHTTPVISTENFMQMLCIPSDDTKDDIIITKIKSADFLGFGSDIARAWEIVLMTLGIAVGLSIIYLFFLRYFITIAIWASFVLVITIFVIFGYFLQSEAQGDYAADGYETTRIVLWVLAIVLYLLALLFLVLSICIKERIDLAVAIMKSAVMFIADVWKSLLVPLVVLIISVSITCLWVLALVYLYTSGTPKECTKCPTFGAIDWDETLHGLFWFELLGIFWVNAFKIAATQFIIAYAAASWYFTHKSEEGTKSPVWRGVSTLFSYHIGSIALGSLIIGLTLILKFFLKIVAGAVKRGANNPITKVLCICCICCIGCIEKLVSFLDEGVYIRIALLGEPFCRSARNSFALILENAGRFTVLAGVSSYFSLVGQILITILSTYLGTMILEYNSDPTNDTTSPVNVILAFVIVSFVVSSIFISVYEIACDTIIQSYIIDEKIHKGIDLSAPQPMLEFMRDYKEDSDEGCC